MKLLALSVLLMLACAAFGKAVDEVPVQEEDDTAVEDFELTGEEEQTEDDSNAVMESNTEAEGHRLICWPKICRARFLFSARKCKPIKNYYRKGHKLYGRNLLRCYYVQSRTCHQICYYPFHYGQ